MTEEMAFLLRCPISGQTLSLLQKEKLDVLNRHIAEGLTRYHDGRLVGELIDGALMRNDGLILYPIMQGIPRLVAEAAILSAVGIYAKG